MRLHILRHGKTNQKSPTGKDYDRELLPKGIGQCSAQSKHIRVSDDCTVWCSAAKRTRQTYSYLNASHSYPKASYFEDLYLCSRDHLLKQIWQKNDGDELFLIGHNFGISDLASYFLDELIELRTGEYICLAFPFDLWSETSRGTASLVDRFRPEVKV